MMKNKWFILVLLISVSSVFGADLTVPGSYSTIQAAIDAASATDTVIVSPGTYIEKIDLKGKAILLCSTDPNDPSVIASTIIDGGGSGTVITCDTGETSDTVITGFWIRNGNAGAGNGGGIYCKSSHPTIKKCVFSGNAAGNYGGGIFCWLGAPNISNCIFIGNFATNSGGAKCGGGIGCYQSGAAVTNCVFSGNHAYRGGGIACYQSDPTITNCTFSGNAVNLGFGGALYCNASSPTLTNCILWGNSATLGNEVYTEAGSDPVIRYSVIEGGWAGSGSNNFSSDPLFVDADGGDDVAGTADDDLHLDPFTYCINAGDPLGDYTGQRGMDGEDRVLYGSVDIGADEVFPIGADLNADEQVDTADIILFVDDESWLVEVNLVDFALFAGQWLYGAEDSPAGDLKGDGSEGNPYLIENLEDFDTFADPNNAALYWASGVHAKLMTDIDLSGRSYTQAPIAPERETKFNSTFDGGEYTISNLTITGPTKDVIGLFGWLDSNGQIKNLGVVNINIQGKSLVGGLVGYNSGTVSSCYVTGVVSGWYQVGGLVGFADHGTLTSCYATGVVTGVSYVGGLVGDNSSTISSCYVSGAVSSTGNYVGGLVGDNSSYATITSCYATATISGNSGVGGLCGSNDSGVFTACYWDSQVSGTTDGVGDENPDPVGVDGKTTVEMMAQSTFTGWDFSTTDGDAADWMMLRDGEDYPRLAWQAVFEGDIAGLYGVDMADFAEVARNWQNTGCPTNCEDADIDENGEVGLGDLAAVAENWLLK